MGIIMKKFLFVIMGCLAIPALSFDSDLYEHLKKVPTHSRCNPEEIRGYNRALKEALNPNNNFLTLQGLSALKKWLSVSSHRTDPQTKVDSKTGFRVGHGSDSLLPNQLKSMSAENACYFQAKLEPYYEPGRSLHDSLEVLSPREFCLVNYYVYIGTPADKIEKELKELFATIEAIDNLPLRRDVYAVAAYIYRRLVGIHPFLAGNGRVAELVVNNYLARNHAGPFKLPPAYSPQYIQFNQYLRSALIGDLARRIYPYEAPGHAFEDVINKADRVNDRIRSWFKGHHNNNWDEDFNGRSYLRSFMGFCQKKRS